MSVYLLIALALIAAAVIGYIYVNRRKRKERIAEVLSGADLLAQWAYSSDEWRKAAEEEFDWVKNKDSAGQVYITPSSIYITNGAEDCLIDLTGSEKVVTHASCRESDMSPLKIRVRWKVVTRDPDSFRDEVKYYKEDYRIPVPLKHQKDARGVVAFFSAQIENNPQAYANVVSDDEPISIFGKDSF